MFGRCLDDNDDNTICAHFLCLYNIEWRKKKTLEEGCARQCAKCEMVIWSELRGCVEAGGGFLCVDPLRI